jgi:hypothetical protein
MWPRILLAGILAGILVFVMGAVNHMVFQFQGRTLANVPDQSSFAAYIKSHEMKHGLYVFPDMPTPEDQKDEAKMAAINDRYKAGPSGMLLIAHTGDDMMNMETLGKELASNVLGALIVSWVISLAGAEVGFFRRWLAVALIGLFAWISISASYGIWYRFPHNFLHDELFCALIEWSVAGFAIAAIVRRPPAASVNPAKSR